MDFSAVKETAKRGTFDFPIEYYKLSKNHPRYHMQTHWHKDMEIIRVTTGVLDAQIGDTLFSLKEGESVYIPGGIAHGAQPTDCEYECVVLSPSVMYSTQKVRTIIKSRVLFPVKFYKNPDVDLICECLENEEDGYEFKVISSLFKIVNSALENQTLFVGRNNYRVDKIKPAIDYIRGNFSGNIELKILAEECSMSSNYFCKIFKDVTGQTPTEYITTYRLNMACEMLLSGSKVTDTAYDCGFNDLSYFIHVFKKNIGISPKQYSQNK